MKLARTNLPLGPWHACVIFCGAQFVCRAQSGHQSVDSCTCTAYYADSSPAIAPDGTIYQATFAGKLLAVTPEGNVKWTFKAGREIKSSPAIAR